MSFHPMWPLLILALAAFVVLALGLRRRPGSGSPTPARRTPVQKTPVHKTLMLKTLMHKAPIRRLVLAGLVVLVALRPIVGGGSGRAMASDLDLVLVIDRTTSMGAQDWNTSKSRLSGAAADVRTLVEAFPGARFSLVTFDTGAWVELPFTTDGTAVVSLADTITPQNYLYSSGTTISRPLVEVETLLTEAKKSEPGRSRYVVYLGDGEHTANEASESFETWKPLIDGGRVLGYGSVAGAKVPSGFGDSYVFDYSASREAITRIDEPALQRIADELSVGYEHRTAPGPIGLRPRAGFSSVLGGGTIGTGFELYWIFGLGVLGLAAVELWSAASMVRRLRQELT